VFSHLVLFLFVRISPSRMRAKTELAKYCPIKIKKITLIAKAPKKIFLTIGLAGFFNQYIFKSTHHPKIKKTRLCVELEETLSFHYFMITADL